MLRASLLLAFVVPLVVACGNKSKGPPLAPLPPDEPTAAATPDAAVAEPEEPTPPPALGPIEATIPTNEVAVKLVSPGKGKRVALKLAPKPGTKQQVELVLDFSLTQSAEVGGTKQSQTDVVPTVVLGGEGEAKAVGADGAVEYALAIAKTDARETPGSQVPIDKFRGIMTSLVGLTFSGKVGANGATSPVSVKLEKPGEASAQVIDLVGLTLPVWPPLPAEPVGVGAKWQATSPLKLAGRLDVTQTIDYELVSYKNNTWTIKGKIKITGADQMMQGGRITKIAGSGTHEITLVDGALYPTHKRELAATFTASEATPPKAGEQLAALNFEVKLGGAVTAK